jgi:hypothetical protein
MRSDVLVCKASGEAATVANIAPPRSPIFPLSWCGDPRAEPGDGVDTVEAALNRLAHFRCRVESGKVP